MVVVVVVLGLAAPPPMSCEPPLSPSLPPPPTRSGFEMRDRLIGIPGLEATPPPPPPGWFTGTWVNLREGVSRVACLDACLEVGVGAGSEKTSKCQSEKPKRRAKNIYIYKRRDARDFETLRSDLKCAWRQIDPLTRNIFKIISLRRRFKRLRANIERGEERGERGGEYPPHGPL